MKKVLKVLGIILIVVIIAVFAVLKYMGNRPAVPTDYQTKTKIGGEIEAKYMANGPYEASVKEEGTLLDFGKFWIYYPSELPETDKKYPVIVICNGSGTPLSKYPTVAKHYASWGFIVIGTEETNSWNAFGAEMSIRYLERMNENQKIEDTESIFYQKVDFDNVGIVGHSQGGVGVISAITDTKHKDIYKTAVSLSPTNKTLAHNLFWDYDASQVNVPILLISGEGGGDDWVVTGEQLVEIYEDIPDNKIAVRRKSTSHNEILYKPDGYITAWFMYYLQGDEEAGKAFFGVNPEILHNELYTDQMIHFSN
ncbi:MAG: hypothetical protein IJI66_08085 [Erysipelotrichaceae bacterium]|nr:hypothetical protein [Erysipelotrichaceae bacterium]